VGNTVIKISSKIHVNF